MDKAIQTKYGKLVSVSGQSFVEAENDSVSISPALDIITGGIPGGSYVVLTGEAKCGKSTMALHIARNAQKMGRKVYYFNIEGRLKQRDLLGISGLELDEDKFEVVRSYRDPETDEKRILFAHEFLEIGEYIIHTAPRAVLVFDSISMLLTEDESTSDLTKQHRAPGAKLMANFLRRMSNVVPVNDTIVICIQQIIANTSGFGAPKVRSGGRKIQYAVDIDLEAKKVELLSDDNEKPYAQKVTWRTGSTATIAPGQTIVSTLRYGVGIDEVAEIVDIGISTGFIEQSSSWFNLVYMDNYEKEEDFNPKIQGKTSVCQRLKDHPKEFEYLKTSIDEMMGQ